MGIGDGYSVAFHSMPAPENAMRINAVERLGTYRFPIVDLDVVGSNPITRPSFRLISDIARWPTSAIFGGGGLVCA
jgi:hypothetical protein